MKKIGYHIIPHAISQFHLKTIRKYINQKKYTIGDIWIQLCNDYQMKIPVSLNEYSKEWNWHRREVKELLSHLGFDVATSKGKKEKSSLKLIEPIQSNKFPKNTLGLAKNIFGQVNGQQMDKSMDNKDNEIPDTYEQNGQVNGQQMDKSMDINNIIEFNRINNRSFISFLNKYYSNNNSSISENKNKKKKNKSKKSLFNQYDDEYFNKIWELYRSIKNNPKVFIKMGSKKEAYKQFQKLKLSPEKIYDYVHRYITKCVVTEKYAMQVSKLLKQLADDGFREDLDSFNPKLYLTFDDIDLQIANNGSGKKLLFLYKGQPLNQEEIILLLQRRFKSRDFSIMLMKEFKTYIENEMPEYLGDGKALFEKFLIQRRVD